MKKKKETLENISNWVKTFTEVFLSLSFTKKYPSVVEVFGKGKKTEVTAILHILEGNAYRIEGDEAIKYLNLSSKNIGLRLGHKREEETNKILNLMALTGLIYRDESGWRITVWDDDDLKGFAKRVNAVAEMDYLEVTLSKEWVSN